MSRTVHTRPKRLIAVARLDAPFKPRGFEDWRASDARHRELRERGLAPSSIERNLSQHRTPHPRIIDRAAAPGTLHPATRADIADVLRFFGPQYTYGLRSIELRTRPTNASLCLGRLLVPGRVILFAQPEVPWILPGSLSNRDADRLRRAGAIVTELTGIQTVVDWPDDTLRQFMLLDVLMHEVGHHMLQQHARVGRRTVRVARTGDHESYADAVARACREQWLAWESCG